MGCESRRVDDRKRKTRYPKYHRNLSREYYLQRFLSRALSLHTQFSNWDAKTLLTNAYAIYEKALQNANGKIHFKQFQKHIDSHLSENAYLLDPNFIRWLESPEGQYHLSQIQKLHSVNERIATSTSLVLLYMQAKDNLGKYASVKTYKPLTVENIAFKIWSKPWTWLLANIFIFDVMYPTASWGAEYRSYSVIPDPNVAYYEAIRVNPKKWYEISRPASEKILWDALYEIGFTVLGELVSAGIASRLLLMASSTFMRLGSYLYNFSKSGKFSDTFQNLGKASSWIGSMLEKSFFPFLGMQIYVEWPTDGFVQWTLDKIVRFFADPNIRKENIPMPSLGIKELDTAMKLIRASLYRELKAGERQLLNFLLEHAPENQRKLLEIAKERAEWYRRIENIRNYLRYDVESLEKLPIENYDFYSVQEDYEHSVSKRTWRTQYVTSIHIYGVHRRDFCWSSWHEGYSRSIYTTHRHHKVALNYSYGNELELSKITNEVAYLNILKRLYFLSVKIAKKCNSIVYQKIADRFKKLLDETTGKSFTNTSLFIHLNHNWQQDAIFEEYEAGEPPLDTSIDIKNTRLYGHKNSITFMLDGKVLTLREKKIIIDGSSFIVRKLTAGTSKVYECEDPATGEKIYIPISIPSYGNEYLVEGYSWDFVFWISDLIWADILENGEVIFYGKSFFHSPPWMIHRYKLTPKVTYRELRIPINEYKKPRRKRGKVICKFLL